MTRRVQELEAIQRLREMGALTEEEFEEQKRRILGNSSADSPGTDGSMLSGHLFSSGVRGIHIVTLGAFVCLLSIFTPMASLPLRSQANLMSLDGFAAFITFALSLIALGLAAGKAHRFALFPGIGNALLSFFFLVKFLDAKSKADEFAKEGEELGPLTGLIGDALANSVMIHWGWPLWAIGSGLLIYGSNKAWYEHKELMAEIEDEETQTVFAEESYHSDLAETDENDSGYNPSSLSPKGRVIAIVATILAFLAIGWFFIGSSNVSEAQSYRVTGTANVRNAPTTEGSEVVSVLQQGDTVTGEWVEGSTDATTRWLRLKWQGSIGYVWEGNLLAQSSQGQQEQRGGNSLTEVQNSGGEECPFYDERDCAVAEMANNTSLNLERRSLIERYSQVNGNCRGGSGNLATTWHNCAKRDVLSPEMREAGLCYGKETDRSLAEAFWHICSPGSDGYSAQTTRVPSGQCRITLEEVTSYEGTCFINLESEGTFWVLSSDQSIFASVERNGRAASAMLSIDGQTRMGDGQLGAVFRDGACWRNDVVDICAWTES